MAGAVATTNRIPQAQNGCPEVKDTAGSQARRVVRRPAAPAFQDSDGDVALSPPETVPASEIEVLQTAEGAMALIVRLIPAVPAPNRSQISVCDYFLQTAERVE